MTHKILIICLANFLAFGYHEMNSNAFKNQFIEEVKNPIYGYQKTSKANYPGKYNQEYLEKELSGIRKVLLPINKRKIWTATDKRNVQTKELRGMSTYYYFHQELQKIEILKRVGEEVLSKQFYMKDRQLIFVLESSYDPLNKNELNKSYENEIDSFFFQKAELIRIKSNMDCGAPFSDEYRNEEEVRLNNELQTLLSYLNK